MCIACEFSFWNMVDALSPEEREKILREQAATFACDAAPVTQASGQEPTEESKP